MTAEERVSYRDKLAEAAKHAFADLVDAEGARLLSGNPWQALERALAAAAAVRDVELDRLSQENDRLRQHILDINAHATPYGDIPEDPGYVGTYLVTAGALHRALGRVGHTAPKCEAEARLEDLRSSVRTIADRLTDWCHDDTASKTIAGSIAGDLNKLVENRAGDARD